MSFASLFGSCLLTLVIVLLILAIYVNNGLVASATLKSSDTEPILQQHRLPFCDEEIRLAQSNAG